MNYYIQGDAANADKIKAAFEKLGMSDLNGYNFGNRLALFYTYDCGGSKVIATVCVSLHIADIIKTHHDYKELELPVQPKFKVGDEVVWTQPKGDKPTESVKIIQLIDEDQLYRVDMGNGIGHISYDMQDYYKLVPKPHYDIKNFHAGMPVLVRWYNTGRWRYSLYSFYEEDSINPFDTVKGSFTQCIPYEGNEHLLGNTDMPDEMYINW